MRLRAKTGIIRHTATLQSARRRAIHEQKERKAMRSKTDPAGAPGPARTRFSGLHNAPGTGKEGPEWAETAVLAPAGTNSAND